VREHTRESDVRGILTDASNELLDGQTARQEPRAPIDCPRFKNPLSQGVYDSYTVARFPNSSSDVGNPDRRTDGSRMGPLRYDRRRSHESNEGHT
jgi:hypothetical protein